MSNPSPAPFLSPPPRTIFHTPPSLSATPSTNPQHVSQLDLASLDSTRDLSQNRSSIGQLRASPTDSDPNGEQSRITMQTRVAVRDATPHRFQIVPLREHRLGNLPEAYNGRPSEPKDRPHQLIRSARPQHATLSKPLSCVSRVDENNKPLSVSSAHNLWAPQSSTYKRKPVVFPASDAQTPMFVQVEKRASTPPSKPPLRRINPEKALRAPPSLYELDLQKPYQRNVKSNMVVQDNINGSSIGSATGRMKCRVCSEDLTRCGDQRCTHGYLCLRCPSNDPSWHTTVTITRRQAIYTDALLLPIISRGSSIRRMWRAPVAHNHEADQLSRNHYVGPRYSQGASIHTSDKGLHVAPGIAYNFLPGNVAPAAEYLCQSNAPAESCVPPVPRLRLSKKTRNLSTPRANFTHEGFAKHSSTILELIALLDQAIRDWKELGRDHAVLCTTVRTQGSSL